MGKTLLALHSLPGFLNLGFLTWIARGGNAPASAHVSNEGPKKAIRTCRVFCSHFFSYSPP